jgi:4'-phosphopantetheinyl transferase EntD
LAGYAKLGTLPQMTRASLTDTPANSATAKMIESVFPSTVFCVYSSRLPPDFQLLSTESNATKNMVPRRVREFTHGRYCARTALERLGCLSQVVPVGAGRAPVWPPGITGSLAHHRDVAVAVVARREDLSCLGVDLEAAADLDHDLVPLITTAAEIDALSTAMSAGTAAKIIFSAKESVFKCLWPSLERYIDFMDIEIVANPSDKTFLARPENGFSESEKTLCGRLQGRYEITGDLLVTAASVSP